MDTVLPVTYQVSFVGTQPTDPLVNSIGGLHENLQSRGNNFTLTPEPGAGAMMLAGLIGVGLRLRRGGLRAHIR